MAPDIQNNLTEIKGLESNVDGVTERLSKRLGYVKEKQLLTLPSVL